jgi:Protein of unknown function (DUF3015)
MRMKKVGLGLGLALVLMLAGSNAHAQAKGGYGMAGCGLGSLLFGGDNSKLMQILASTTNGTFASQTFGITSGTSNCVEGGVLKAQREQEAFAEVNFQDLKRNMATGGGEYLTSFSTLLGCTDAARPVFYKMTQEKYESILPTEKTTPTAMLMSLKQQIKSAPALATSCTDERALARATTAAQPTSLALTTPAPKPVAKK